MATHSPQDVRDVRDQARDISTNQPFPSQSPNGDETQYVDAQGQPTYIVMYSKGLPHPNDVEVDVAAYQTLLTAVASGDPQHWEQVQLQQNPPIPVGKPNAIPRKLKNPQAGLAYDLEGPDIAAVAIKGAPKFQSAEAAAEMAEAYWMALLRDVRFAHYGTGLDTDSAANKTADAANSLSLFSDFRGPKNAAGTVTPAQLFRGNLPGDQEGPYISQFLIRGVSAPSLGLQPNQGRITFGNLIINQAQYTVRPANFLKAFQEWRDVQNRGVPPGNLTPLRGMYHIRNGRDLAHRVRSDRAYQHYLNAALILMNVDPFNDTIADRSPLLPPPLEGTDSGNPYGARSQTQEGFATFGDWHILTLLAEVTTRALQAAWYQKWFVHRRLRPEEFAGRVYKQLNGGGPYNIHTDLLNTTGRGGLLQRVATANGSAKNYLLSQAYPEGAPLHPSYPSGHATVAGACVTILKAHFNERLSFGVNQPGHLKGVYEAAPDGQSIVDLNVQDPQLRLTITGELNKLASNMSLGRSFAGVHYRSDYLQGVYLGEAVARGLLQEQIIRYNENKWPQSKPSYQWYNFDGNLETVS